MNIVLIGIGGHSKVIRDLILSQKNNEIIGYLDGKYKDFRLVDNIFFGPILSAKRICGNFIDIKFVIAIGDNKIRKKIAQQINLPEEYYATLVHKSAVVSPTAKIGKGTVVMPNTVINADAEIGQHTIINTGSVIEHDCMIGDFAHVSPGATLTGAVQLEEGVSIGAGATIIPNIKIGKWSVIGAGATVIHPIPPNCTAVGIPALINKVNEGGGEAIDRYII
jgi:acetyltransferase EpsM